MVKGFGKVKKKTLNYAYIPMGSRDFGEGTFTVPAFWIKSTEVSNLEYRTFLFDLLIQDRKEDFLLAKPDQQQWKDEFALKNRTLDDLVENYFSHSAYNRHPVVGVSRKGAEMYCEWFTLEYKKTNPYSALFRLPTDIEWRYAAAGVSKGDKYPIEQSSIAGAEEDLIDVDGVYLANYRAPKICRKEETDAGLVYFIKYDGYLWSRPKHATNYPPSEYGLYHMAGNISEMIYYEKDSMRPGTRGGNFESLLNELEINGPDHFKGRVTPSIRIGFRPVLSYDRRVVSSLPSFGSEENLDSIYCADKVKCSGIMPKKSSSVTMSFTVDKEGELTHVYEVESSKSKVPDWMFQEAKRVLVDMPKWQPASINGTLVSLGDVRLEVSFEKCLTQD